MPLRPSTPEDLDVLFDLWRRAVEATHDFLSPDDLEEISRLVRQHYLPDADLVVLTDPDGRPRAFMGMTGANVDSLFVDPDWHGRGAGRALIEHAARQHPGGLTVDVNEANVGAVRFYERMGFAVTGRSPLDGLGKPYPLLHMRRP